MEYGQGRSERAIKMSSLYLHAYRICTSAKVKLPVDFVGQMDLVCSGLIFLTALIDLVVIWAFG